VDLTEALSRLRLGLAGLGHSYPALFALAGLSSVVAGITITRVRSVC
jgi:hypothetical protein